MYISSEHLHLERIQNKNITAIPDKVGASWGAKVGKLKNSFNHQMENYPKRKACHSEHSEESIP